MQGLASDVARSLDRFGVSFMLVGAAALAVRGFSRGTHDVDFMTTDVQVLRIDWAGQLSGGTAIEIRRGDHDDPLAGVVSFAREGSAEVDLVVARWKWQQAVIDRSALVDLESFSVRVPCVEDLVRLKLDAGSVLNVRRTPRAEGRGPREVFRGYYPVPSTCGSVMLPSTFQKGSFYASFFDGLFGIPAGTRCVGSVR